MVYGLASVIVGMCVLGVGVGDSTSS
jgi:hypothetical protein